MDFSAIASAIKTIAIFLSVIVLAYAGLVHMTSRDPVSRNEWKEIASGVFIGLSLLFLAPILASALSGGGYCIQ